MDESVVITSDEVTNAESCDSSVQDKGMMSGDAGKMIDEQRQDETLSNCWKMARQGKDNFVISRELLYHKDKVKGQAICQLCVSISRRNAVLNLAHNSVYGSHMGERKTCQRIKLSFFGQG